MATGATVAATGPTAILFDLDGVIVDSESLRVPIFIAYRRYDYDVPYALWADVASTLATETMQVFERSGHQPFLEEPDRFAQALTDWMRERR